MVNICPFCGALLETPFSDGITTCLHCGRVFDDSPFNRLLCAAWAIRKKYVNDVYSIQQCYQLEPIHLGAVQKYVMDCSYNHDEFYKIAKHLN